MTLINLSGAELKTPNGETLWSSLDLNLDPGQICGIVGESGSGKSSLTQSLLGFLPDNWSLSFRNWTVLGSDYPTWKNPESREELIKKIFYVPQNPNLAFHPYQKIGSQFADYIRIRKLQIHRQEILSLWEKMFLRNPSRIWNSYPKELSGGEKQRLCLSLGILNPCPIFVLDEPTTGLDSSAERWFLEEIKEIAKKLGTGILFISHDLRLLERFALRITIMKKGDPAETIDLVGGVWKPKGEYGKKLKTAYDFFHSPS